MALCREPTEPAGETGVGTANPAHTAGETGAATSSAESGNKKAGRSIVYSPSGWYDNAPSLSRRGCAALKVVGGGPPPQHRIFKRLAKKNF